jgi:4-alpha-glucanotransferase
LFLNPLYLDVVVLPEFQACPAACALLADPEFRARLSRADALPRVAYREVSRLKSEVLAHVVAAIEYQPPPEFGAFVAARGTPLREFAVHCAIAESLNGAPWQTWPEGLRCPDGAEIQRWAEGHAARVRFHMVLQWLTERQLADAGRAARRMKVGLMRDLAVGVSPDGADAWREQTLYPAGVRFGAPPDDFAPAGQDWGMAPPNPFQLRRQGYASFIDTLRANMAHAGALRIDHVMGLQRLFWIPPGAEAAEGAYVRYPRDDLFGILALESARHHCLVVGEDLGTVPDGFRERMDLESVLSTRLFYFERHPSGLFKQPPAYPARCVAQATTHDLPTLAGFWAANDLTTTPEALAERERVKDLMLAALRDQGLLGGVMGEPVNHRGNRRDSRVPGTHARPTRARRPRRCHGGV